MNLSETKSLAKPFSHIYVEDDALNYPLSKEILGRLKGSHIIKIKHYKDIFNRAGQDFLLQKQSRSLILSVNRNEKIYPGARVCQSFGNDNFYYTSNIMNCIFDCEYCYLQGMYPSGNIVIFVNYDDYFSEIEKILAKHDMYICISYDTDLLAMENLTGFVDKWIRFTLSHPSLKIEIRTKSAFDTSCFPKCDRVIFAWTLPPEYIIERFEHFTPSLDSRINAVKKAIDGDYMVRLCFDPMIYVKDYKEIYKDFYEYVFSQIDGNKITDASLGLFRISSSYIKSMKKKRLTEISAYPYTCLEGVCQYEPKKSGEMLDFAGYEITKYISREKLFID